MKSIKFFMFILLFAAILANLSIAQVPEPKIKIKSITVSGIKIDSNDYRNVVLSEKDSIDIEYKVITADKQTSGYFYRINITNKDQQSTYTSNSPSIK